MSITLFNDFMTATDQTVLTSAKELVNEAVERSYTFKHLMRGQPDTEVVQGGSKITDQIMFDDQSTYEQVAPNQTFNWRNPQSLEQWEINWRFGLDHMVWTDHEIELQVPAGLTRTARSRIYKDLKHKKERSMATSLINGLEAELWALPVSAEMESATGKAPYSIPAHINEYAEGKYPGWTTKQGLLGGTGSGEISAWQPTQIGYTYQDLAAITTQEPLSNPNVIAAFDEAYLTIGYDELPGYPGMAEAPSNANMILASLAGVNLYRQALRTGNDTYVTPDRQDPAYMSPKYAGIPVVYASKLDTAALYTSTPGAAGNETTELDATVLTGSAGAQYDGPRYYWINRKYFRPTFHSRRYMYKHPVRVHPNQPSTHVQVVDCWHNYPVQSLQRHAIVYPNG